MVNKNFLIGLGLGYLFTRSGRRRNGDELLLGEDYEEERGKGWRPTDEFRKKAVKFSAWHGSKEARDEYAVSETALQEWRVKFFDYYKDERLEAVKKEIEDSE